MKRHHAFIAALALLTAGTHVAVAQGMVFQYPGKLPDGSSPAEGTSGLRLNVYNAASGGVLIGAGMNQRPNLFGVGKPTSKQIEERTDLWAFLAKNLSMTIR